MNLKLMLSYEGVQYLRDLAMSIKCLKENMSINIDQLVSVISQIDNLGPHRTKFIELLYVCKSSLLESEELFESIYVLLLSNADMIEGYLSTTYSKGQYKIRT